MWGAVRATRSLVGFSGAGEATSPLELKQTDVLIKWSLQLVSIMRRHLPSMHHNAQVILSSGYQMGGYVHRSGYRRAVYARASPNVLASRTVFMSDSVLWTGL